MTYPIYTYGSGYIEWYALSSIAALTSSALFAATLKVLGLLAAVTVFIGLLSPKSPITQGGHIKIGVGFISIILVSMLIFGPKINVAVIDSVSPLSIPNSGVVNSVPIGVGLPISLASQVTNGLVNGIEAAFSSPAVGGPGSSTDFTSAGMGVAISMPLQSYSDAISDPTLQSNFNYYFENCIDPAIANGTVSPSEIADAGLANPINNVSNAPTTFQAQSLWSLFQSISNQIPGPGGLTTNFIDPTTGNNSTVSCQNDYTNVYNEVTSYGQTFFQQESESLGYTSYSAVSSLLSNINQNVLNVGNDGMTEQMQAFAVNLTNSAIPQIAASSGISSTQAAYSTGMAEAGWGASIAPMLLTAQQFMPGMLSLLFVIITIASPFLLMFLMFPWGGRYLQIYVTLLLWMVLWLPMAAVINFILQLIEHESFLYNYSVQGYSLASAGVVNHFFIGQLEIATVLMTSIPVFTYYLASASSMGMVSLAGTIDSSIKGGSMAAANSSMQGVNMDNNSIGNTSMHNFSGYNDTANNISANKADTTVSSKGGVAGSYIQNGTDISYKTPNGNVYNTDATPGGVSATSENGRLISGSNPMFDAKMGQTLTGAATTNYTNARSNAETASQNLIVAATKSIASSYGESTFRNGSYTTGESDTIATNIANAISKTASRETTSNRSVYDAWKASVGADFTPGIKKLIKGKLGIEDSTGGKTDWSKSKKQAVMANLATNLSDSIGTSKGITASQGSGKTSGLTKTNSALKTAQENFGLAQAELKTAQTGLNTAKTDSVSWAESGNLEYAEHMGWSNIQFTKENNLMNADPNGKAAQARKKWIENDSTEGMSIKKLGSQIAKLSGQLKNPSLKGLNHINNNNRGNVKNSFNPLSSESYKQAELDIKNSELSSTNPASGIVDGEQGIKILQGMVDKYSEKKYRGEVSSSTMNQWKKEIANEQKRVAALEKMQPGYVKPLSKVVNTSNNRYDSSNHLNQLHHS